MVTYLPDGPNRRSRARRLEAYDSSWSRGGRARSTPYSRGRNTTTTPGANFIRLGSQYLARKTTELLAALQTVPVDRAGVFRACNALATRCQELNDRWGLDPEEYDRLPPSVRDGEVEWGFYQTALREEAQGNHRRMNLIRMGNAFDEDEDDEDESEEEGESMDAAYDRIERGED